MLHPSTLTESLKELEKAIMIKTLINERALYISFSSHRCLKCDLWFPGCGGMSTYAAASKKLRVTASGSGYSIFPANGADH